MPLPTHTDLKRTVSGKSALINQTYAQVPAVPEKRIPGSIQLHERAKGNKAHKCYFCGRDYPTENALRSHALHTCSATGGKNRMATAMLIRDVNKKSPVAREDSGQPRFCKTEPMQTEFQDDMSSQIPAVVTVDTGSYYGAEIVPQATLHKSRDKVELHEGFCDPHPGGELIIPEFTEVETGIENVIQNSGFPAAIEKPCRKNVGRRPCIKMSNEAMDEDKNGRPLETFQSMEIANAENNVESWKCVFCHKVLSTAFSLQRHLMCLHNIFITTKHYTVEVLPPLTTAHSDK